MFIVKVERVGSPKVLGKVETVTEVNDLIRQHVLKEMTTFAKFSKVSAKVLNDLHDEKPGTPYELFLDELLDVRFSVTKG